MDWIVLDCFEAGKRHYLALRDWASGMVWGQCLKSMNTQVIIDILSEFCDMYFGPMWHITSDGGSNLTSTAVEAWCKHNNVIHSISAAKSLESNGESKSCVKRAKLHILKCAYEGKSDWASGLRKS